MQVEWGRSRLELTSLTLLPPFCCSLPAVKDPRYTCVICRGLEPGDAPSANTCDARAAADAADATSPRRRRQQQVVRQGQQLQQLAVRTQLLDEAEQLGIDVPKGLGGAALRSYLLRMKRQRDDGYGEDGADDSSQEPEQPQPLQQRRPRGRPARTSFGSDVPSLYGRPRRHHRHASSGTSDSDPGDEEHRPKQRKLGGAALASHLRRLEQRRQQRQQHMSADDQPSGGEDDWPFDHIPAPSRKLGGAALKSYIRRQELLLEDASDSEAPATSSGQPVTAAAADDWPFDHIPPPPRKLGGAALKSYIRRQELLLEEEDELDGASDSDSEEPSTSHGIEADDSDWPFDHIPAPSRKLGGAALKSYIRRQELLLEGKHNDGEPSGSSSGTAEEFGASSSEDEGASGARGLPADPACACAWVQHSTCAAATRLGRPWAPGADLPGLWVGAGAANHSGSSDEEPSEHKENHAPAKRHRSLVGAAQAAHVRKQRAIEALSPEQRHGPSSRRGVREAPSGRLQSRRG